MPSLCASAAAAGVAALLGYCVFEEDQSLRGSFARIPAEAYGKSPGREDVYFPCSGGLQCHAWLFRPDSAEGPSPVVVMGHGIGAQKDFGLENFARGFAKAGIAAFVFDYRHWGGSEGEPRHIVEVYKQHQDWFSALDFVLDSLNNELGEKVVEPSRVAVWGSSFAGGHAIAVAGSYARKADIKAVVSQVPLSDGAVSLPNMLQQMGLPWALSLTMHSIKDMMRRTLGMSRHHMAMIDESLKDPPVQNAHTAVIGTPECANYWRLIKGEVSERLGGWQNKVPASIGLEFPFYRPVTYAPMVEAPTLGIYAEKDSLCPVAGVKDMFNKIKAPVETKSLPGGHFDAYLEEFENVLQWEVDFLVKHLVPRPNL